MYVRTGMGAAAAAALADDDKGQKPDAVTYQAPSVSQVHTHTSPSKTVQVYKEIYDHTWELMSHHYVLSKIMTLCYSIALTSETY